VVPKLVACPAESVSAHGGGNFGAGFGDAGHSAVLVSVGVVEIHRPPSDLALWQEAADAGKASLGFREQKKQGRRAHPISVPSRAPKTLFKRFFKDSRVQIS
jgi:hypothetical protein